MIAARLLALAVHPLLNYDPMAVIGNDEAVQIKIETVLHGGASTLATSRLAFASAPVEPTRSPIAD